MHPNFIAALFTIAKTWKQPKCPSTGKRIRSAVCTHTHTHTHTHTMEYNSAIKRMKFFHLHQHGWIWRTLCLFHLAKNKMIKEEEQDKDAHFPHSYSA